MNPKILVLTKYSNLGASSRLRTLQYVSKLSFVVKINSLLGDDYISALYGKRSKNIIKIRSYFSRILKLSKTNYNLLYIEKELFPYMPYFLEYLFLRNKDYILDFDDAIFHNYDCHRSIFVRFLLRNKVARLIRNAKLVIVGNDYLKSYALKCNAKTIKVIPTSIDLNRYVDSSHCGNNDVFTIGWIGTPSTKKYLTIIHDALKEVSRTYKVKLSLIGISGYAIEGVNVECEKWSEENEAKLLNKIDLGVMPIPNLPFERGKCGYKIIQYGASQKASIASPVGANNRIISQGENGYLAETTGDWIRYLTKLITDKQLRSQLGLNARKIVEEKYSVQVNLKHLEDSILSIYDSGYNDI